MRNVFVAILALGFCAVAHAQLDFVLWDPMTVRVNRTDPVKLEVQLASGTTASAIRMDYAGGGSLTLTPLGGGRFTASIPAAQLFSDYKVDDVNRNFVGFLRLLDAGGQVQTSFNAFIS